MTRLVVFGSTGMLGSAVYSQLKSSGMEVIGSSRSRGVRFDVEATPVNRHLDRLNLKPDDYLINCIGLTKARISPDVTESRRMAVDLNILFPHVLAAEALERNLRVIQVATDCVFNGKGGPYYESHQPDALDLYGVSKAMGEPMSSQVMHLRSSLVGPELGRNSLLFEWVRNLPQGARVVGYKNHLWNGLTSQTFAKIVSGIIDKGTFEPGKFHVVPANYVTKFQLIRLILEKLGRKDITVKPIDHAHSVDRRLGTEQPNKNAGFFKAAGYNSVPTIEEMLSELDSYG